MEWGPPLLSHFIQNLKRVEKPLASKTKAPRLHFKEIPQINLVHNSKLIRSNK
jgi:hypothetical protein